MGAAEPDRRYGFGNPWRLTGHTFPGGGGEPGDRAGCYAVTFAANATVRGIELSRLELEMKADFDLQGFLNLDDSVRPGAQEIRVTVHAESPNASREQLQELTDAVQRRSPIRDTLANPVTVSTTLAG